MKSHKYRVTVTRCEDKDGNAADGPSIEFTASNHDEIIQIARLIQDAGVFPADEAASFAIGLKLFGETMLIHKEAELFTEIRPHFIAFMKKLKASLQSG